MSKASSALSMPEALRAPGFVSNDPSAESMPRDFFSAFGALPLGLVGNEASSSRRRASFSAFLRAASAAFSAAASLCYVSGVTIGAKMLLTYAFAFDLAPLPHSSASAFSTCWFFAACFEAAASALRACPCAFFEFSPPPAAPPFFAII